VWLKWEGACLASTRPEFKNQYKKNKKQKSLARCGGS
jgi:hypothetical protein